MPCGERHVALQVNISFEPARELSSFISIKLKNLPFHSVRNVKNCKTQVKHKIHVGSIMTFRALDSFQCLFENGIQYFFLS